MSAIPRLPPRRTPPATKVTSAVAPPCSLRPNVVCPVLLLSRNRLIRSAEVLPDAVRCISHSPLPPPLSWIGHRRSSPRTFRELIPALSTSFSSSLPSPVPPFAFSVVHWRRGRLIRQLPLLLSLLSLPLPIGRLVHLPQMLGHLV